MEFNKGLVKKFKAVAAILPYRIVKFGANDTTVITAVAVTDALIGVSDQVGYDPTGANTSNNRYPEASCEVLLDGGALITYGGTVVRGDQLTCDAVGRAVTATPAVGVNNRIIGVAMRDGVIGDIGTVLIRGGSSIQG